MEECQSSVWKDDLLDHRSIGEKYKDWKGGLEPDCRVLNARLKSLDIILWIMGSHFWYLSQGKLIDWIVQLVWTWVPSTGICFIFIYFRPLYLLPTSPIWTWPLGIYSIPILLIFQTATSWHFFSVSLCLPAHRHIPQRELTSTCLSPADSASNK